MTRFIRQNATHKVMIGPFLDKTDGFTPETGITLSGADEAEALQMDDTSIVAINAYTWAAITTMDGHYNLTLQTAITDKIGHLRIVVQDDSVCLPVWADFTVVEEVVYDALYAASAGGFLKTGTVGDITQLEPPLTATPEQMLNYIYRRIVRNKVVIDTNTLNQVIIFLDDGTTKAYTQALTDASSITTIAESIVGT